MAHFRDLIGQERREESGGEVTSWSTRSRTSTPRRARRSRPDGADSPEQFDRYLHALDLTVEDLGLKDQLQVARDGFIVLSRPGSNFPSVRAGEDLEFQARRAQRGFELLEQAAHKLPAGVWAEDDKSPIDELIQLVIDADCSYGEACLSFCGRASGCHERSLADGYPVVLGEDVRRFCGNTDLNRVVELLGGSPPTSDAEADLVRRIEDSEVHG